MMPSAGTPTAITEIPLSGGASGSVRQTTVSRSAPFPSQPVPLETHFFAPEIAQRSPSRRAWVRTPSAGAGAAKLALPPGSLKAKAASGAPCPTANGAKKRAACSGPAAQQHREEAQHGAEQGQRDVDIDGVELLS